MCLSKVLSSNTNLGASAQLFLAYPGSALPRPSRATWRGTNGLWNDVNLKELASTERFQEDPVTVWRFYGESLLEALEARPNAAHHALAALANWHHG